MVASNMTPSGYCLRISTPTLYWGQYVWSVECQIPKRDGMLLLRLRYRRHCDISLQPDPSLSLLQGKTALCCKGTQRPTL